MSVNRYSDLKTHVGHRIEIVTYGDPEFPVNVACECIDCGEVLFDYDNPAIKELVVHVNKPG